MKNHWLEKKLDKQTDEAYKGFIESDLTCERTSEFGEICSVCNKEMWPFNNAHTMMQGDPMCACFKNSCNLDIFYPSRFIQGEQLQVIEDKRSDITQFQTMFTPVLPGTMTGTVYPTPNNKAYGFTFCVSESGLFNFTQFIKNADGEVEWTDDATITDGECLQKLANGTFDDRFMGWYDEVYSHETTLNYQTGVLELHYHMGHCPEIFVSYEYNRE